MRPRLDLKNPLAAAAALAAALLLASPAPAQPPPAAAATDSSQPQPQPQPGLEAPALVLDPDLPPEGKDAGEDSGPDDPDIDFSAPGMTGASAGSTPISLVEAAYLAHRRGDFQAALEGYTRIIRRRGLTRKERAVSYLLRGEAQRDSGQLEEAILDFTRALRQWPGYPTAHYFRGRVYERQNRLNEAYADLARAVQLDPAREAYVTSLTLLKLRLKEAGLLNDQSGPPPEPVEPPL